MSARISIPAPANGATRRWTEQTATKDRMKGTDEREATCTLGTGVIDFQSIINAGKQNGMEYFIVEQERYDGTTPLASVEANAKYMNKLTL